MPDDAAELAALRAEVALLRSDLDRALEQLDLPHSKDREEPDAEWPNMAFKQVNVRHSWKHIPIILYSDTDESAVLLHDAEQRLRGRFSVYADGQARLEILNAERQVVVSIGEGADGRGEIRVNDADGTTRAGMKVGDQGGAVSVVTTEGKVLAALASGPEGGKVFVCSPQPKAMVTITSAAQGGIITLAEPGGQTMASVVVTELGAVLNIHGEQGVPVAILSGLGDLGGMVAFSLPDGTPKALLPDAP